MKIGEVILEYRRKHKLSQRQFAKKCGDISNGYISMLENDMNPATNKGITPTIDKLKLIANGMEMSLDQLLRTVDDMPVDIGEEPKRKVDLSENVPSDRAMEIARVYDSLELHTREVIDAIFKIATQNSKPESDVVRALKESEERKLEEFANRENMEYKSKIMR